MSNGVFGLLDGYRQMLTMTDYQHDDCLIGNLVLELTETHPKVRELLAANFDNWKKAIAFARLRIGCLNPRTQNDWLDLPLP